MKINIMKGLRLVSKALSSANKLAGIIKELASKALAGLAKVITIIAIEFGYLLDLLGKHIRSTDRLGIMFMVYVLFTAISVILFYLSVVTIVMALLYNMVLLSILSVLCVIEEVTR